jgi:hypothetical protein
MFVSGQPALLENRAMILKDSAIRRDAPVECKPHREGVAARFWHRGISAV